MLAKHALVARSLQNPTHVPRLWAGSAVRLATDSKMAPVKGSSIRLYFSALREASHLPVGWQQRQKAGTAPR